MKSWSYWVEYIGTYLGCASPDAGAQSNKIKSVGSWRGQGTTAPSNFPWVEREQK